MKRKFKIILGMSLLAGLVLISCKKDEKKDEYDVKYASYTAEENKQNLEDMGVEMMSEVDALKDEEAIQISIQMLSRMLSSESEELKSMASSDIMAPIDLVSRIKREDFNPAEFAKSLKDAQQEDPESLGEFMDEYAGTYTWNFELEDFDYVEGSDVIIINFPALETHVTNTATLTISNVADFVVTESVDGEMLPNPPLSLSANLAYNSSTLISYNFTATYQSNGMPTSISTILTIGAFSFSADLTHTPYTKASVKYSFKHTDDILLEFYYEMSGNWDEDHIASVDEDFDIINSANAYIQIMDIKVKGRVNAKGLADKMEQLDKDENADIDDYEAAINQYVDLIVIYVETGEKICEADVELIEDTYDVCWSYDYYTGECTYWDTETEIEPVIVLTFSDGSPVNYDEYFGDGFDEVLDAWEDFEMEVNDDLGLDTK